MSAKRDYSLYILKCADGTYYTGIACDVSKRLQEHEQGERGAKYLQGRAPFDLVFECPAGDRSTAQKLEHRVKRLNRAAKQALTEGRLDVCSV